MIEAFKQIGENKLKNVDETERLKEFLVTQAVNPVDEEVLDKLERNKLPKEEIVINLNTETRTINVKLGGELRPEKREKILAFEQVAAKRKKFFATNNLSYHILGTKTRVPTVPGLIEYICDNFEVKDEIEELVNYLNDLSTQFYKKWEDIEGKYSGYYLNFALLSETDRQKFLNYYDSSSGFDIASNVEVSGVGNVKSAWTEYVSKEVIGSTKKNAVDSYSIFSLKVNNKYIQEMPEYKKAYVRIAAHDFNNRFFDKKDQKTIELDINKQLCSVCNKYKAENIVTGEIDIPTKFYIPLYGKDAYRRFSICEDCYQDVIVGINSVSDLFSSKLFRIRYYLIPQNENIEEVKRPLRTIQRVLETRSESINEEFDELKKLVRKTNKYNLKFDFLFWRKEQASFIVIKHISDVYYKDVGKILENLVEINGKPFYNGMKYPVNLNTIYWLLFPNHKSHSNPDPSLYRKELINLLEALLKGNRIDYQYLIKNFNSIFRKTYFRAKGKDRSKNIILNPIKMNILISIFNRITKLKGGFVMASGSKMIDMPNEDIQEFFEVHSDIYEDNFHRQGLVVLGVLINAIMREQKEKSSNFFSKVSLDGIRPKRVNKLIGEVTKYLEIYKIYKLNSVLYSAMMDRIQGIENSGLTNDEVVFYILTGISLGRYLGYKYSQEKISDEQNNNEEGEK